MATMLKTALRQSINAVAASGASLDIIADIAAFATLLAIPLLAAGRGRANPMMRVVNRHSHKPTENDVYCGRGSALGNPYQIGKYTRDEACDLYDADIKRKYRLKQFSDTEKRQLRLIANMHKTGCDVNLVCYCYPQRCHCYSIITVINWAVEQELAKDKRK